MSEAGSTQPASATIATKVNLAPKASQTFLVSLSVLAGVCVVCSAALFFVESQAGWIFIAVAVLLMGAGVWAWRSSQSDIDLQTSTPTMLALPDGTKVSTDSRTLRSSDAVTGLLKLCEAYQRAPLPPADGLIENGKLVPNSAQEAQARVQQINEDVEAQAASFDALVNPRRSETVMIQESSQAATSEDNQGQ